MGRNIYFSNKELSVLRRITSEWCSIMEEGDQESCELVNHRLTSEGLGSALRKLYANLQGEQLYEKYK